jgi:hypothetical protein
MVSLARRTLTRRQILPAASNREIAKLRFEFLSWYREEQPFIDGLRAFATRSGTLSVLKRLVHWAQPGPLRVSCDWQSITKNLGSHLEFRRGYSIIQHTPSLRSRPEHRCLLNEVPQKGSTLWNRYTMRLVGDLVGYTGNLRKFADFWGLRAEWAYDALHAQLLLIAEEPTYVPFTYGSWGTRDSNEKPFITVDRPLWRYPNKHALQNEIAGKVEGLWESFEKRRAANVAQVGPNRSRDIKLLFRRCCPLDGKTVSWSNLDKTPNEDEEVGGDAIRHAIPRMAKWIGISLPPTLSDEETKHRFKRPSVDK